MSGQTPGNQKLIVSHAVLAGLTPLIPIPIVDDIVRTYFVRRLVRMQAANRNCPLTPDDVRVLADAPESGCLGGCLLTALLIPFKLIFRKIFFFLEWKRAVDTVSRIVYQGYLVDAALEAGWCAPGGPRSAMEVRAAIDDVLKNLDTRLLERSIKGVFSQSKSVLKGAAGMLERSLRGRSKRASREQIEQAVEAVEHAEEREIEGVAAQVENALRSLPPGHFNRLRSELAARLGLGIQDEGNNNPVN
jgi:hypothetical protein